MGRPGIPHVGLRAGAYHRQLADSREICEQDRESDGLNSAWQGGSASGYGRNESLGFASPVPPIDGTATTLLTDADEGRGLVQST
jgi:hypothetical protein